MLRELQGKNGNGVRSRVVLASILIFDFLFISRETPFSFKNIIIIIIIIIIRFREDDDDDEEEEEGLLLLLSANTVPFVFERFFFSRVLFPACLLARVVGRTVTRQSLRWWIRIDGRQTFPTDDDSESSHRRAWIARRKTRSGHRCRSGRSYAWNVPACTDRSACTSRSSAR